MKILAVSQTLKKRLRKMTDTCFAVKRQNRFSVRRQNRSKICLFMVFFQVQSLQGKLEEKIGYSFRNKLLKSVQLSVRSRPPADFH